MSNTKALSLSRFGLVGYLLMIIGLAGLSAFLLFTHSNLFEKFAIGKNTLWSIWGGIFTALFLGPLCLPGWLRRGIAIKQRVFKPDGPGRISADAKPEGSTALLGDIKPYLRNQHGPFWRQRTRILLLVGEPAAVEAIAPGLTSQLWLEGEGTVLLWGGEVTELPHSPVLSAVCQLHRRPLDGVVWVTDGFSQPLTGPAPLPEPLIAELTADKLDSIARALTASYQQLGWQLPLFVWGLQHSRWSQDGRKTQSVGCLLPPGCQPQTLTVSLTSLTPQLIAQGTQQLMQDSRHDFLLRLAWDLLQGGIERLTAGLAAFLGPYRPLPLAGVVFSLPLTGSTRSAAHSWGADNSWQIVLESLTRLPAGLFPQRTGGVWRKTAGSCLLTITLLAAGGLLVSWFSNRQLIISSVERAKAASAEDLPLEERLNQQSALQQSIATLQHRQVSGVPWYTRLGLSYNNALLQALWPRYAHNNSLLIRDQAAEILRQQLAELAAMPSDRPLGAARAKKGYDQLKAYLMMARPEKSDPAFLLRQLQQNWPQRQGVSVGLWQAVAPPLLGFYSQNLASHPQWKIPLDNGLVSDVRRILLREMVVRNAETTLYQTMLQQVAKNYGDMHLGQMIGDTDARQLFSTHAVVPGIFTRSAWENEVSSAIDKVVRQRREEIDWVLSDSQRGRNVADSPEALKARLSERYFTDFATSWQGFLNSIQWHQAQTLSDAIEQLALMADFRESPLIALFNTLAYQGSTDQSGEAVADSLVKSAKNLLNRPEPVVIDQSRGRHGPLDSTFGPLLALMDNANTSQGSIPLSLQSYLTRVTRVRLKLQQITSTADAQVRMQELAQTVFQGNGVDLTETRDYGSLLAAGLGQQWQGLGQALFVSPMEQAWQQVLMPTARSLNEQWQAAIVNDWQKAFSGRYPFNAVGSDASLPLLSQYLRADTGRIQRFLESRLAGVLRKEGSRWVPNSSNTQGLTFNPEFLEAVNLLGYLADVVFVNGEAGMHFALRPGTARGVVQTDLLIDNQPLSYFNQLPVWTQMNWPADTSAPGASLRWISNKASTRIFAEHPGHWGLIRLLQQAQVTANPGVASGYTLRFTAQDGLPLLYELRTELDEGPLALLRLRGFVLPKQIFLTRDRVEKGH
jgi:type VI secretion system protein ImpL